MSGSSAPSLRRKLGVTGAMFIGLGSMIGAGVFSAFAPATHTAGTLVNLRGITRTAQVAAVLVAPVLVVLVAAAIFNFASPSAVSTGFEGQVNAYGVLQAAGLLFFAFAGYARIATLGEEVVNPARTIRRAIVLALSIVFVLYFTFGASLLWVLGPKALAQSTQPALDAVQAAGASWAVPLVLIAVGLAALGSLLYYFITNVSAWRQPAAERMYPRWVPICGAVFCVAAIATLPLTSLAIAAGVVAVGVVYRIVFRTLQTRKTGAPHSRGE